MERGKISFLSNATALVLDYSHTTINILLKKMIFPMGPQSKCEKM